MDKPINQEELEEVDPHDSAHQEAKPPSVRGEEDPFSGDMPGGDYDIDNELKLVGRPSDDDSGPTPLGSERYQEEE